MFIIFKWLGIYTDLFYSSLPKSWCNRYAEISFDSFFNSCWLFSLIFVPISFCLICKIKLNNVNYFILPWYKHCDHYYHKVIGTSPGPKCIKLLSRKYCMVNLFSKQKLRGTCCINVNLIKFWLVSCFCWALRFCA